MAPFTKKKFFVCFEKDGVVGVLVKTWSDAKYTYIDWFPPVDIDFKNILSRVRTTKVEKAQWPSVENVSNGFCFVVRNYDSAGNMLVDEKNPIMMENRGLRTAIRVLLRSYSQLESVSERMSKNQQEELLRSIEIAKTAIDILPKRRDDEYDR